KLPTPEQLVGLEPLPGPAELAAAVAGAAPAPPRVAPRPAPPPAARASAVAEAGAVATPARSLWLDATVALLGPALVLAWLTGSVVWFGLVLWRIGQFRRLLHCAQPAGGELAEAVARLANRVGLRRPPEVRLLPGPLPPLVWAATRRPVVLLPADLLATLDAD